jgi:hypothetical protein
VSHGAAGANLDADAHYAADVYRPVIVDNGDKPPEEDFMPIIALVLLLAIAFFVLGQDDEGTPFSDRR